MAHLHSIYDTDPHFSIDPVTRAIKNESTRKTTLVQGDHNSERFTFEMPRMVEGHDMSLSTRIEVHFINIASDKSGQSENVYIVDDMQISPNSDDESVIIFSWLLSGNATLYNGSLAFAIRFVCLDGETLEYAWHTAPYTSLSITKGINNGEAVIEDNSDILAKWEQDIDELTRRVKNIEEYGCGELEIAQEIGTSAEAVLSQNATIDFVERSAGRNFETYSPYNLIYNVYNTYVEVGNNQGVPFTDSEGNAPSTTVEIPITYKVMETDTIMHKPVVSIVAKAFASNSNIERLITHDGLFEIRGEAFNGCSNLRTVVLANSIRIIRYHAFNNCKKLTNVVLPKNLEVLGKSAFYNAPLTGVITIPSTCTYIGENGGRVFNSKKISAIVFEGTPVYLDLNSFGGCTCDIYVPWSEGAVSKPEDSAWGSTGTVHYDYRPTLITEPTESVEIVQDMGEDPNVVMSQKAVYDMWDGMENEIGENYNQIGNLWNDQGWQNERHDALAARVEALEGGSGGGSGSSGSVSGGWQEGYVAGAQEFIVNAYPVFSGDNGQIDAGNVHAENVYVPLMGREDCRVYVAMCDFNTNKIVGAAYVMFYDYGYGPEGYVESNRFGLAEDGSCSGDIGCTVLYSR